MIASVIIVVGLFIVHWSLFTVQYLQAVIASVMIVVGLFTDLCSLFAGCDRLCADRGRFVHCSLFTVHYSQAVIASVMIVVCSLFIVHYLQAVIASVMTVVGLFTVHCSLFAGRDRLCDDRGRFVHCSLFTICRL